MKRFGQLVIAALVAAACGGTGYAQTTESKWSGQIDGAATLGHSSSTALGAEIDYRWSSAWEIAFEAGRMANVTSSALEERAQIVGDVLGVKANPVQRAIYYDLGVRYRLMPEGKWNPYLAFGFGGARVNTETSFEDADLTNVLLGNDLDGHVTKAFLMLGGGVNVPYRQKYFFDGSVRWGRIFAKTGDIEADSAVSTLRVQVGFGLRF
mgnify:CR=1 FL=1